MGYYLVNILQFYERKFQFPHVFNLTYLNGLSANKMYHSLQSHTPKRQVHSTTTTSNWSILHTRLDTTANIPIQVFEETSEVNEVFNYYNRNLIFLLDFKLRKLTSILRESVLLAEMDQVLCSERITNLRNKI